VNLIWKVQSIARLTKKVTMNQGRARSVAIVLSCVALVAAGCSTTASDGESDLQRSAQAVEDQSVEDQSVEDQSVEDQSVEDRSVEDRSVEDQSDVDSEPTETAPSQFPEDVAVGALLDGVRVCVRNERTTVDGKPALINLTFEDRPRSRSWESDYLPPGSENCVESSDKMIGTLAIMYTEAPLLEVEVYNPPIFPAHMTLMLGDEICIAVDNFAPNRVYDNGFARYVLERQADSKNLKNFSLVVSDSRGRNNQDARC